MDSSRNTELIVCGLFTKYPYRIKKQLHKKKDGNTIGSCVKENKFIIEDGNPKLFQVEGGKPLHYPIIFEEEYIFLGGHCYNIDNFILFMKGSLKQIECIPEKSTGRPNGTILKGLLEFWLVENSY
tara:strand:- start:3390 stop:3767 length:378 start_codon:yes stop_codon:yes gene_type:complete